MKAIVISLRIFVVLTIITGIIYPLFITGFAQIVFPAKANGSLIVKGNKKTGSELIGQMFDTVIYFASRPSTNFYDAIPSGGSNYGLTNIKLKNLVNERKLKFITYNQLDSLTEIPSEMLFSSASGLDPHISPKAALLQVNRIAKARNFDSNQKLKLEQLVKIHTEMPQFLFLGEDRINVLLLNLEADKIR
jgi:potassium-transporting ATPase KdpC subunit